MTTVYFVILLICVIVGLPSTECACTCPDGWVIYKNSCYKFVNEIHNYNDAKALCKASNSHLVEINNADEDAFLENFLIMLTTRFVAWFGASDAIKEGTWVWGESGHAVTYTNWGPGQPGSESGNEDCGVLQNYGRGVMWYDARCVDTAFVICEKSTMEDSLVG